MKRFKKIRANWMAIVALLISFVALLISLATAGHSLYIWLQGPDIKLFSPVEVTFFGVTPPGNTNRVVTMSARMAYINSGGDNYNGILNSESVEFNFAGKDYEMGWLWFDPNITGKNLDNILNENHQGAYPSTINGKSAISHETFFSPRRHFCAQGMRNCDRNKNFLDWNEFIKKIEIVKTLDLTFKAGISGHLNEIVHCKIQFDEGNIRRMKNLKIDTISCSPKV